MQILCRRQRAGMLAVKSGIGPLLLLSLSLTGCANLGYYWQSASGQLDLVGRAQPIQAVLDNPATAEPVRRKLAAVLEIREFASGALQLPDNDSYRRYADLERPYAVWNVFAAPEFSVQAEQWCFPVAGCVNYRGYFAKQAADKFAAGLEQQGYDVFVGGVPAYSTLGWFSDPVLNTFIHYSENEIARLIFHELSHQLLYVKDDSVFNESFAVSVETEGMRRWLESTGSLEQRNAFERAQQRKARFIGLIQKYRSELAALYGTPLSDEKKRETKADLLLALQKEYRQLKESLGGVSRYDVWLAQLPNNAHLASVAIYTEFVPAFQALLAQQQGDLSVFYAAAQEIARLPKDERTRYLQNLMDKSKAQ